MSKVIQFPGEYKSDLELFESIISGLLDEHSASRQMRQRILPRMRKAYIGHQINASLTVNVNSTEEQAVIAAFEKFNRQLTTHTMDLLLERFEFELEWARDIGLF
ncbi:MAG: hypothetical protein AAF542_19305 [Pseudomonadota bacterium]